MSVRPLDLIQGTAEAAPVHLHCLSETRSPSNARWSREFLHEARPDLGCLPFRWS